MLSGSTSALIAEIPLFFPGSRESVRMTCVPFCTRLTRSRGLIVCTPPMAGRHSQHIAVDLLSRDDAGLHGRGGKRWQVANPDFAKAAAQGRATRSHCNGERRRR